MNTFFVVGIKSLLQGSFLGIHLSTCHCFMLGQFATSRRLLFLASITAWLSRIACLKIVWQWHLKNMTFQKNGCIAALLAPKYGPPEPIRTDQPAAVELAGLVCPSSKIIMDTRYIENYDSSDTSAAPTKWERPITRQQRRSGKGKKNMKRFINWSKSRK